MLRGHRRRAYLSPSAEWLRLWMDQHASASPAPRQLQTTGTGFRDRRPTCSFRRVTPMPRGGRSASIRISLSMSIAISPAGSDNQGRLALRAFRRWHPPRVGSPPQLYDPVPSGSRRCLHRRAASDELGNLMKSMKGSQRRRHVGFVGIVEMKPR
jgi:hypothetical protein